MWIKPWHVEVIEIIICNISCTRLSSYVPSCTLSVNNLRYTRNEVVLTCSLLYVLNESCADRAVDSSDITTIVWSLSVEYDSIETFIRTIETIPVVLVLLTVCYCWDVLTCQLSCQLDVDVRILSARTWDSLETYVTSYLDWERCCVVCEFLKNTSAHLPLECVVSGSE